MSFLDDLVGVASSAIGWFTGNSTGAQLARTALTGYALNKVTSSINKENSVPDKQQPIDPGVRVQVDPDTEYRIPVVYGTATLGGAVTDAVLTNNNGTMYYCLTICERTGNVNLGQGAASTFRFLNIYWEDQRLIFNADGVTVRGFIDASGQLCETIAGAVKVYCFGGGSTLPVAPYGYTNSNLAPAYNVMPNWTSNHTMNDLVFAIVQINYDATKRVTGLQNMKFQIENSMSLPGDCLYDYMTNTRYGAGIPATEIYVQ